MAIVIVDEQRTMGIINEALQSIEKEVTSLSETAINWVLPENLFQGESPLVPRLRVNPVKDIKTAREIITKDGIISFSKIEGNQDLSPHFHRQYYDFVARDGLKQKIVDLQKNQSILINWKRVFDFADRVDLNHQDLLEILNASGHYFT